MKTFEEIAPDDFLESLKEILEQHPDGLKEFDLMHNLSQCGLMQKNEKALSANLELYHRHFILFHALYLLRDRLIQDQVADIKISALCIQLLPFKSGTNNLARIDSLREFYLDLNNLTESTEETVNDLFASFWKFYLRNDKRSVALAVMGLQDPVEKDVIIKTYRQLVMRHHPDRGGDKEQLQSINKAYAELIK